MGTRCARGRCYEKHADSIYLPSLPRLIRFYAAIHLIPVIAKCHEGHYCIIKYSLELDIVLISNFPCPTGWLNGFLSAIRALGFSYTSTKMSFLKEYMVQYPLMEHILLWSNVTVYGIDLLPFTCPHYLPLHNILRDTNISLQLM